MYIKEIRINGFKSFADRINLTLNKSFTGIVGPNGSGKSNIVDAIKWVLGEQSVKTLRGSNGMTDVIFAGCKSRTASSSASVCIVFDNSLRHLPTDYNEVSIKRVVYKSGENEYFLNGTKCRLKDITDLFVDSFSSKESFNIISQGKVSELLSNKPEEKRIILEEAAGVIKYKKRKEEALKKLSKTNENVSKIDMIISELNESVIPLENQARKAKLYKEAKSKLENIEIALTVIDINNSNKIYKEKVSRIEEINEILLLNSTDNSKEETLLEKLKLDVINIDNEISSNQKLLIETNNIINKLSKQKELFHERSKYSSLDIKVKNNLIDLKERKLKLDSELKVINSELEVLENEINDFDKTISKETEEYKEKSNKSSTTLNSYNSLSKKELEIKNKIELVENSIASSSRIPYSVKSVIENPMLKGVESTIGSVIDTKEEYSLAIETSLGAALNFVIVQDERCAKEAINYLKNNNKGRVTFFPRNVIKPKNIDENVLKVVSKIKGFISIASNLVTYDEVYSNIVSNQLGNIIVVDNIDNGLEVSKQINYRYRVVTLDGELIHVGGSLTGGSKRSNTSIIGDKFELKRLNNVLEYTSKEKRKNEGILNELNSKIELLKDSVYKVTSLKVKSSEKFNAKSKQKDELIKELEKINDEISALSKNSSEEVEEELSKIMEEFYKEESNKSLLENSLNKLVEDKKELNININELEESIKKANLSYNRLSNELKALEIENVKIGLNLDNMLKLLNENYNLTFEKASEEYELDINIEEARNLVRELKSEIRSYGEVNLGSILEYERVNSRFNFLKEQKEDLLKSEENLLEIINEMDEVMESKFIDTFHKVNAEFSKVFNKLFGGGHAELVLTDSDNILETGIVINAVPPGKKLTNMSLLSGGEKTLTAISLLFAIMNINFVPFAILDEVEAALDEANVDRFGEYLENYRDKTQLLIITHKKKTMEYVDLLYGITMQESGVSKIVSVKLEDIK